MTDAAQSGFVNLLKNQSSNEVKTMTLEPRCTSLRAFSVLIIALGLAGPAAAQTKVEVVGVADVRAPKPIPHSELLVFRNIAVSPTKGCGTGGMTLAGLVPAQGYTSVMLSLAVENPSSAGSVTAYLVPTEKFVSDASLDGEILFPLAAEVSFSGDEKVKGSLSFEHQLAFPEYAVYLSNHSERPVKAQFFVYLRH
jgi:hypothetical protein